LAEKTFFRKYFTVLLAIIVLSLFAVGFFSTWSITLLRNKDIAERQKEYTLVMVQLLPPGGFKGISDAQSFVNSAYLAENLRLTVVAEDGTVLGDSHTDIRGVDNHNNRPEIRMARNLGAGEAKRYSDTLGQEYQYTAVLHAPSQQVLRVSMAVSNIKEQAFASYLRVTIFTVFILCISLFLSYSQAQTISRMLNSLRLTAQDYAHGDFSRSLCLTGFKEALALSQAVNAMGIQLKQKIQQLTSEKEKSQAMLNHMSEPVMNLNHQLQILEVNQATQFMAGLTAEDCKGKNLIQIFRSRELCEIAERAIEEEKNQSRLIHWKEEGRYLQVHVGLLRHENEEEVPSLLMVMSDVSEIKQLELMRKDFVGNVSHELRTPVTSILGFADTLLMHRQFSEDKLDEFIQIIRKQGQRLALIIEDLLTLSSLEDEHRPILKEKLSAQKMIASVLKVCNYKAEEASIEIKVELCSHDSFQSHKGLVEQAMINYLENAIKYSPRGTEVLISSEVKDSSLVFHVIDQGPGIPLDQQSRIFERFYRVDKARSRDIGGTGLGLSIVKHISQKMGGSVGLFSKPGQGCDFYISFPL